MLASDLRSLPLTFRLTGVYGFVYPGLGPIWDGGVTGVQVSEVVLGPAGSVSLPFLGCRRPTASLLFEATRLPFFHAYTTLHAPVVAPPRCGMRANA